MSETHLDSSVNDSEVSVQGYSLLRKDRDRKGGGICLFIRNSINFNVRGDMSSGNVEAMFIEVLFPKSRPFLVGVLYRPPSDGSFLDSFRDIVSKADPRDEVYMLGDFNICMKQNGSSLTRRYRNILSSFSMTQMIDSPTRITTGCSSILDHAITNRTDKVSCSGVLDLSLSDHQAIYMIRGSHVREGSPVTLRRRVLKNYSKELLCNELRGIDWSPVYFATDVNIAVQQFNAKFLSVIDRVAPYRDFRPKLDSKPWMCGEILAAIKKRDLLFRRFKKNREDAELYKEYCRQRNAVQRDVKFAKADYFRRKLNESKGDSGKLWKHLRSLGYSSKNVEGSSIVLENNGVKYFGLSDVSRLFNEFYTSVASDLVSRLPSPSGLFSPISHLFSDFYRQKGCHRRRFVLMPVNGGFIRGALEDMKPNKSTGLDDISARFLKDGVDFLVGPIGHIVNTSIMTESVPDTFKEARVTPLYKKGSRLDAGNYRPVSILPVLSKVLEKAVNSQLRDFLESGNVLFDFQSGFRGGFSTDTCLTNLTDHIRNETAKGNVTGMVLIDLQKAFDTCDHSILLQKLKSMGVASHWFRSYLSERRQCVRTGGTVSSFLDVTCGVPQGSILGPTLFLCYINDMSMALNCHLALYADDSALIYSGPDSNAVASFLSEQMTRCSAWLIDNRLSLHVGKTECIIFGSRRRLKGTDFLVRCGEAVVKRVMSVKYLGVILDENLSFRDHVTGIVKKATGKLYFLYRSGASLDSSSRRLLCSSLVSSGLEYCVSAWYPGLLEESKKSLATLQRKMVRFVSGMGPREHVADAEISSLGWLPFQKRVEFFVLMHVYKVRKALSPAYISRNFVLLSDVHSHSLRQSDLNYSIAHCSFPPGSFTRTAITWWNRLPADLKQIDSVALFRKCLKAFLSPG